MKFTSVNCYDPVQRIIHQIKTLQKVECPSNVCNLSNLNFNIVFKKMLSNGFIGANLSGAVIENSHLQNINLRHANLTNTKFTGSILNNVDLYNADIDECSFKDATLVRVNLLDAKNADTAIFYRATIIDNYSKDSSQNNEVPNPFNLNSNPISGPQQQSVSSFIDADFEANFPLLSRANEEKKNSDEEDAPPINIFANDNDDNKEIQAQNEDDMNSFDIFADDL